MITDWIRSMIAPRSGNSSVDAKQRLKVLLVHDEIDLPPSKLQEMQREIMEVIAKYVDVQEEGVSFELRKEEGTVALVSQVPVRRVHARA